MNKLLAVGALISTTFAPIPSLSAEEHTSENTPFLKGALQKYPEADINKDGILTEAEAVAYRDKLQGAAKARQSSQAAVPCTFTDVAYGQNERNVLDFWQAKSDTPAPVMVCIHGGGFLAGDKKSYRYSPVVPIALSHGISVVAINYRYTSQAPFPAPMLDAARAIQFIRTKAKDWNIDPARIGVDGGSAGGNMGVWLACHPDLADKDSADEVARQSSRISFACGHSAQTFNDPEMIHEYIYQGTNLDRTGYQFFGVKSQDEMTSDRVKKLAYEASATNYLSKDSAPTWLSYNASQKLEDAPYPEGTPFNTYIHHAKFGQVYKEKCDALGVECELHCITNPEKPGDQLAFVLKHFGLKDVSASAGS